ncbi:MAG: CHAT domain-containing protein, partial [Candidatus Binatia bacterium]
GLEIVLRRKGIVLDAQSRTQHTLAANLQGDTLQSWQRLIQARSALAHLLLRGPAPQPVPEYKRAIDELQGAIAHEETFLARQSSVAAQELAQKKVTAQRLAARLPRDGILIEFVHIQDFDERQKQWSNTWRYLSFILTPDNQVHLVDVGDAREIDAQIEKTLSAINTPTNQEFAAHFTAVANQADTALAALSQMVLQPLAPHIGARTQLIVSPDGELNRVPFAALQTADGRYLIEHLNLAYVASGRDLLQDQGRAPATVDLLLVANPAFNSRDGLGGTTLAAAVERAGDFDNGFAPLLGTAQEAEAIPLLLESDHKPLQQAQATESAVRAVRSPKILHLATHGFFLKNKEIFFPDTLSTSDSSLSAPLEMNPMVRSGLALAGANHAKEITNGDDGLLTALEVTSMDLRGTDLVVLSACETGLGKVQVGEGVYGLRRAFTLAGAKNLVMSLWKANDLMTLY